jgi:hypothetical protein
MPKGAVLSEGSSGESISHFAALRVRAYGDCTLHMYIFTFDDIKWKTMVPFVLQRENRITPTRIVNFKSQRAGIELKTSGINEFFRVHRIIVFSKVTDTSYPGS